MKAKFGIPNAAAVGFVLESDGCEVDAAGLADFAETKELLVVLCEGQ